MHRHKLYILPGILLAILVVAGVYARPALTEAPEAPVADGVSLPADDSLAVSVITCYPGSNVYELYGHTAVRIRSPRMDSVWNFGVFDFQQPNFILRFSLGKTDYCLASETFDEFMAHYRRQGRHVEESRLNLSQKEARQLLDNLRENALPQNREYRYSYLKDNCATRVYDCLEMAVGDTIPVTVPARDATYRQAMKRYHKSNKWYNLGIDVVLGSEVDRPMTVSQQIFLPLELKRVLNASVLRDGRKLVSGTDILVRGTEESFRRKATPDYFSPTFIFGLLNVIIIGFCMFFIYHRKINRLVYAIVYAAIGVAGLLVAYLVIFSEHPATTPNYLVGWLNPLDLIVPVCIWMKGRTPRIILMAYMLANILSIVAFLLLWPLFHQTFNTALLPILVIDLMLAVTYVMVLWKPFMEHAVTMMNGTRSATRKDR